MPNQRRHPTATYSIPPELRERLQSDAKRLSETSGKPVSEGEVVRRILSAHYGGIDEGVLHPLE